MHVKQVQAYLEDQAQDQDQETRLSARSRVRYLTTKVKEQECAKL